MDVKRVLQQYQATASVLQQKDNQFDGKELNAEGQLVDAKNSWLISICRMLGLTCFVHDKEARNKLIDQLANKVEYLLIKGADNSDKDVLLDRINRAVSGEIMNADAPRPDKAMPTPNAAAVAAPAVVIPASAPPPATVPIEAGLVAPPEKPPSLASRQALEADLKAREAQYDQYLRDEGSTAKAAGTAPSRRAKRSEGEVKAAVEKQGDLADGVRGAPSSGPAVGKPKTTGFEQYGKLPSVLRDKIVAESDLSTRRAVATTSQTEHQRLSERPYDEACALIAVGMCYHLPPAQDYLNGLPQDKKDVLAKIELAKFDKQFEDIVTPAEKKIAIEIAQGLQKLIESSDRSSIIQLKAVFPIRAIPPNFATLFPNLEKLEFKADQFYGPINLPNLEELVIEGQQGEKLDLRRCTNLKDLKMMRIREMPDLSGLERLENIDISLSTITSISSEQLPQSLKKLSLRICSNLSTVRLELPALTELHISGASALRGIEKLATPKLIALELSGTKIRELPGLAPLPELVKLQLTGGPLREVPRSIAASTKLAVLSFSQTDIRHLPQEMQALQGLRKIDLSHTKLDHFPPVLGLMNGLESVEMYIDSQLVMPKWLADFPEKLQWIQVHSRYDAVVLTPPVDRVFDWANTVSGIYLKRRR